MSANCSVFIATSLDGYISRSEGSIDWLLDANNNVPVGEDCGYSQFMADVDAIIMGRNTFEQVLGFDPWPYESKPVVVLSQRGIAIPSNISSSVSVSNEEPNQLIDRLSLQGIKNIYVDGGLTIQSFFAAGLIDKITITVIPVLLGSGKSLFGSLSKDIHLENENTTTFDFGFVQNRYRVIQST